VGWTTPDSRAFGSLYPPAWGLMKGAPLNPEYKKAPIKGPERSVDRS